MVIDTSAVLAILFNEPDAEHFESALEADPTRLMSAASLLETAIVADRNNSECPLFSISLPIYSSFSSDLVFRRASTDITHM